MLLTPVLDKQKMSPMPGSDFQSILLKDINLYIFFL